jgi:dienelactone hydrolase
MVTMGIRGRARSLLVALFVVSAVLASPMLLGACAGDEPSTPTRGSTFPEVAPPLTFTEVPAPPGAYREGGADHWYRSPAPEGRAVELGVYLPKHPVSSPTPAVLVLHGGDGLRRVHEDLARAYAEAGFIGIVGCWFDQPDAPMIDGAVSCTGGPTFKGTEVAAVDDLSALVSAVGHLPEVDTSRLAIVGHSYGGAVALMRASDIDATEPIVAASTPFASKPACCPLRKGDRYPLDHARSIKGPVLVIHGEADPIALVKQAREFVAARPATAVHYYPPPATHTFPWQTDAFPGAPAGTTFASQFLADSVAWLKLQFPST